MDAEIARLLPLARHIARDFLNIPGLDLPEIEIQAQEALAAAGRQSILPKATSPPTPPKPSAMPSAASTRSRFGITITMPTC
jgi:hypothetical protein